MNFAMTYELFLIPVSKGKSKKCHFNVKKSYGEKFLSEPIHLPVREITCLHVLCGKMSKPLPRGKQNS